ncbi:hypothetical protein NECAME_10238 [Necator americanus]|uniref:Uncharacterized protein n=1 Tax=Necator americanus TaxID=51031 RepID=W2TAI8_NECAM|nr:hypothetical protein NECAME_10238 [Necator americanus]ETN78609.1 hypothetical protein NECAME_10238 [Necator americanus]
MMVAYGTNGSCTIRTSTVRNTQHQFKTGMAKATT